MDRIVRAAEELRPAEKLAADVAPSSARGAQARAVCAAAVQLARDVNAGAIAAYTRSGRTAKLLSQLRPRVPVYALCEREAIARELALYRGVIAVVTGAMAPGDATDAIVAALRQRGLVENGGSIVVVGASPGAPRTDFIRLVPAAGSSPPPALPPAR
jgi:pyruvate kinase